MGRDSRWAKRYECFVGEITCQFAGIICLKLMKHSDRLVFSRNKTRPEKMLPSLELIEIRPGRAGD